MSNQLIGTSPDEWVDLVGEQFRGGTPNIDTLAPIMGAEQGFDILGAAAQLLQKSPAFMQYAAQRAAASRPMTHRAPLQRARDWQIPLGPVSGAAGTTTTLTVQPQCLFCGEKLMAQDTASPVGSGTRITQVLVGQRLQQPATGGGILVAFLANNALGNGIKWDTCQPAYSIALTVSFISACTFDAVVFGKAAV